MQNYLKEEDPEGRKLADAEPKIRSILRHAGEALQKAAAMRNAGEGLINLISPQKENGNSPVAAEQTEDDTILSPKMIASAGVAVQDFVKVAFSTALEPPPETRDDYEALSGVETASRMMARLAP